MFKLSAERKLLIATLSVALGVALVFPYRAAFIERYGGGQAVEVLTALRDIEIGQVVRAEMVGTRLLPAQYVEPRHLGMRDRRSILGVHLSRRVHAGEAILQTDLEATSSRGRTLSSTIPAGLRATTILTRRGLLGGLVNPGDHIDVLLKSNEAIEQSNAFVILQNIMVLAVAQTLAQPNQATREAPDRSRIEIVTLQVTHSQAALLRQAERSGEIDFVLRNPDDGELTSIPPTTYADLTDVVRRDRFRMRYAPAISAPIAPTATPVAPGG